MTITEKQKDQAIQKTTTKLKTILREDTEIKSKIDPDILESIQKIVELEQNPLYQVTGLLSARLDYFFRFWYAIFFIFYVGI